LNSYAARLTLFLIGVITPVGILLVNGAAFVMRNIAGFRFVIAICALVSSLVLNGLTAIWLLRIARRRRVRIYLDHQEWVIGLLAALVILSSAVASYFTYVGMQDPNHLPNATAVLTAFLALAVPLGFTYLARQVGRVKGSPLDRQRAWDR
jgi:hypothetical protein